ncbi:MAG: flagellar biosynthesis regulator FlaF, partial [Opitutales bacterium]|nr:flagellar biosynthesis regulator FlaF [Opitutales bacterium]
MPIPPNNPYQKTHKATISGVDIELLVLEKASMMMHRCQENWTDDSFNRALDDALRYNQKIWDVFQSDWRSPECPLSRTMRENLLSLGIFVRKSTLDIMAYPKKEKLDSLIQINEHLVSGLKKQKENQVSP